LTFLRLPASAGAGAMGLGFMSFSVPLIVGCSAKIFGFVVAYFRTQLGSRL
jgi:hypothetical protein